MNLSNDPGKTEINFFCYSAIRFPHIGIFLFPHKAECINLQKRSLRNKMYKLHF